MSRASNKEDQFYNLLFTLSKNVLAAVTVWDEITRGWPETKARIPEVLDLENRCDATENEILSELNTSFITPFDRQDIEFLARALDSIVDEMEGISALRSQLPGQCETYSQPVMVRLSDVDASGNYLVNDGQ